MVTSLSALQTAHHTPRPMPWGLSPAVVGTSLCGLSAVSYTAANIAMRQLSALHCDAMWATCCRESVTALLLAAWIVFRIGARLGRAATCRRFSASRKPEPDPKRRQVATLQIPTVRTVGMLVLVGLAVEWGGNIGTQWAYDVLGMAITVPTLFGSLLVASAVLGWLVLGERVATRTVAAVLLLMAAVCLLSRGAGASAGGGDVATTRVGEAVALAYLAGVVFAVLAIAIRHSVTGTTTISTVGVVITGVGMLTLGPTCAARLGVMQLWGTPPAMLAWMVAAGALNLLGFVFISRALEITTVVHANMMNSSQVALAALAGMLVFHERPNVWLALGVGLTILGIILMEKPGNGGAAEPIVDVHA